MKITSDVVKDCLERAIYELRFEQSRLKEEIKREEENIHFSQARVDKAKARLKEMLADINEIRTAAENLGVSLVVEFNEK